MFINYVISYMNDYLLFVVYLFHATINKLYTSLVIKGHVVQWKFVTEQQLLIVMWLLLFLLYKGTGTCFDSDWTGKNKSYSCLFLYFINIQHVYARTRAHKCTHTHTLCFIWKITTTSEKRCDPVFNNHIEAICQWLTNLIHHTHIHTHTHLMLTPGPLA